MGMNNIKIGKLAMMLALSDDEEEAVFRDSINAMKSVKCIVCYVAGKSSVIQGNIVKSVVSSALHAGLIENKPTQIHGILHAILGAYNSLRQEGLVISDLKIKVSVVTDFKWVAVGMYGNSAFYYSTSHERGSLHLMHL